MSVLLDLAYAIAALVTAPVWLARMILTGKIKTDWRARFGRVDPRRPLADDRPTILIHAVSVGEVNAIRMLVNQLTRADEQPRIVIASTTDTGFARAQNLFSDRVQVVRYPFDMSFSVRRFLSAIRPDVAVLVELEVWPNFTRECERRSIPVGVINGRLSARSFHRYGLVAPLIRPSFRRLSFIAAQTNEYAERFIALGVPRDRVQVTDTMKWDTAVIESEVSGAIALRDSLGIVAGRPLIVIGSTAPEEHTMLMAAVPAGAQLLCAPRKPEWFDQAAAALPGCARRSRGEHGSKTGRFLLDTIGELRQAYALADIVVVGRTFAAYGGSDMMEPVALGKATIIGPDVRNFADTATALLERGGLIQTDPTHLAATITSLLQNDFRRAELARNGREVIRERKGASERNARIILDALDKTGS